MNDHDHTDGERKTVDIMCTHANGVVLRLYKPHHHENGADCKIPDPDRGTVELQSGANVVDKAFMLAWLEENFGDGGDLVRNGIIVIPDTLKQEAAKRKSAAGDQADEEPARKAH